MLNQRRQRLVSWWNEWFGAGWKWFAFYLLWVNSFRALLFGRQEWLLGVFADIAYYLGALSWGPFFALTLVLVVGGGLGELGALFSPKKRRGTLQGKHRSAWSNH